MKAQNGFTLIELLLYVGVASLLIVSMASFVLLFQENRIKSQSIAEVEQQGAQVMELMTQTIRNAESVTTPIVGASGSSLTLDVLAGGNDPTVFDLSSGTLRITEGVGSPVDLTNSHVTVSALAFENLSRPGTSGSIQIEFTISRVNTSGRNPYSFEQTFLDTATLYAN